MGYVAYNISEKSREELLKRFPPRFAQEVCHHVTVEPNLKKPPELLPPPAELRVVGYASDDVGLEALVVEVDGRIERPCGGIFHVTHSLEEGRAKVESNDVIAKFGWNAVPEPVVFEGVPSWND